MERNFDEWFKTMKKTLITMDYYVDWEKVYSNVDKVKIKLNILNSLVGSKNIKEDFELLCIDYPEVLDVIPLLLAVREKELQILDYTHYINFDFEKKTFSINDYSNFMEKTGIFELISNHIISNLVDYVLGIEVGLDSNARKNRTGHIMEKIVENFLIAAGFVKGKTYFKEVTQNEIEEKYGLDLSSISDGGKTKKRFDFVFIKNGIVYGCEVNFYNSQGSKLNETARSYKQIALETKNIPGFRFIWITDGKGWESAKNNLRETFEVLDNLYNINDLENDALKKL